MTKHETLELSLFEEGPFSKTARVLGLIKFADPGFAPRILLSIAVTWLPMLILAVLGGQWAAGAAHQSLMKDIAVYTKFFVALPVLIFACSQMRPSLERMMRHFLGAGVVREQDRERFIDRLDAALKMRDSKWVKGIILLWIYASTAFYIFTAVPGMPDTWRTVDTATGRSLSWAGFWHFCVAFPIYQFAAFTLLYRIILWWGLLWRISRFNLRIFPAHPDGAGGLGFLSLSLPPFALVAFAISSAMAGSLADLILWGHASIQTHLYVVATLLLILLVLFCGPLLFFIAPLAKAKREGIYKHGALSRHQLGEFEEKWVESPYTKKEGMLSEPDFSVTVDLSGVVSKAYEMKTIPFSPYDMIPLAVGMLLPFVPVVLLEVPLKEIVVALIKLFA
jgi:hypothetical protein